MLRLLQLLALSTLLTIPSLGQKSFLVNFGSNKCMPGADTLPRFSIIQNPLTGAPELLTDCNLKTQVNTVSAVFVAYNPKNNKIYIADVKQFTGTKIWVLDIGLPAGIHCPVSIPAEPDYSYSYVSNNFEFDNNGDLWSISNYDFAAGTCNLDKFDVTTGTIIDTRVLQFPAGNFPTNVYNGDITILPNGRMFVMLGTASSQLYEVTNYVATTGATANYLASVPKDCFGLAYLNGKLELAGQDFGTTCYYFDYDLGTNTLGTEKPFQSGLSPIDNASFTPAIGCGKSLMNSAVVNGNTANLTYHIYVENIGNVILNDINIADNLGEVFGAGNVSNVTTSFVAGFNNGNLTLNPAFNGTTVTNILNSGQQLPNHTNGNTDYYFKVVVRCRVTNLMQGIKYRNTAMATAHFNTGGGDGGAEIPNDVNDSSMNCGAYRNLVDPNHNGQADDPGENVGTPYTFVTVLPVKFENVNATFKNKTTAEIKWTVAIPTVNAASFEIQFSTDGINWQPAGEELAITNENRSSYSFTHNNIPQVPRVYYRVKQTDKDGEFIYSRVVLLDIKPGKNIFTVYPNPASDYVSVSIPYNSNVQTKMELLDVTGRRLYADNVTSSTADINTRAYPNGTYMLRIFQGTQVSVQKVIIRH
ncbi:MAG: T9SS type A sorting domain-containing protein [Ferruginibacter sp.]